jgi:hypothetical protein
MKHAKKIFLIIGLFVFAALGSLFVPGGKSFAQDNQVTTQSAVSPSSETGDQILALLQELNAIQLDSSIFTDPMFLSLKDYHVDLAPEPKQRDNPFAPIGMDAILPASQGSAIKVPTKATTTPVAQNNEVNYSL